MTRSHLLDEENFWLNYEFGLKAPRGNRPPGFPTWRQIHSSRTCEVYEREQNLGDCDGMWTTNSGQTIGIVSADCVPILLCHREKKIVAALHAGWRGTALNIAGRFIENLANIASPQNWKAVLGPSIRSCCFEVGPEVILEFQRLDGVSPAWFSHRNRHIDLQKVNSTQLKVAGVKFVETLETCTRCTRLNTQFPFASYRRDKGADRNLSQITIIE